MAPAANDVVGSALGPDSQRLTSVVEKRSAAAKLRLGAKNRTDDRSLIYKSGEAPALVPLLRCGDSWSHEQVDTTLLNLSLLEESKMLTSIASGVKSSVEWRLVIAAGGGGEVCDVIRSEEKIILGLVGLSKNGEVGKSHRTPNISDLGQKGFGPGHWAAIFLPVTTHNAIHTPILIGLKPILFMQIIRDALGSDRKLLHGTSNFADAPLYLGWTKKSHARTYGFHFYTPILIGPI